VRTSPLRFNLPYVLHFGVRRRTSRTLSSSRSQGHTIYRLSARRR
jgi:hypothetical protein